MDMAISSKKEANQVTINHGTLNLNLKFQIKAKNINQSAFQIESQPKSTGRSKEIKAKIIKLGSQVAAVGFSHSTSVRLRSRGKNSGNSNPKSVSDRPDT
jgi:hypothetical protein